MGDNLIRINFKLPEAVEFMRGDYIIYRGETFTLNSRPLRKENSTREFEYNCEFQSIDYELTKVEYRLFDNTPIPPQGDFSLMGNARTFMQLLVDNMNRIQTGWTLGEVIDSDFVNLDFSSEDCYTVIGNLSKQFNTEFYITAPKIINLKQKPWTGTVIELSRGKGKGLKNLQELKNDQNKLITSLHVCGGTKNLPSGYRNGATRLQLASGLPLQANTDKYGLIEGSQVFDTIYPRLNAGISPNDPGKVTSVNGLYQFQDANLDFDVNQYLTSETAKVVFNTGELAGYQFDVASYNHATKTFTINPATYENSINLPSDNFKAAVGDKYTLIDIIMPQAYIDRAEAELLTAGQDILPKVSNPPDNYKGDCDPIYFKQNNITISIGQVVRIKSDQLGIDKQKRVIGYTQNMNTPSNYTLEFGELTSGRLQALESNVSSIAKSSVRRSIDAQTSAQEYALAKANLAEVTAKAYADGIVTNEEQRAIDDATAKANAAKAAAISAAADYVDAIKADLQNQIDGNITSWFFDYEPSLANVPAVNWSSDAVRDIHLGDLFYWTSKGYSYRFQKVGSVFSWTRISDTDVTKALADAAKAQDTADSKRRTFIAQPTTPYDIGDLWTQGTAGDIMRCISSRLSGAFVASDWEKAVKYTDDTAVNNLQVGGRNYFANSEIKSTDGWSPYYSTVSILDNSLRVLGNSSFVGVYNYYTQSLDAQKEVTISFFAKNNKSQAANVYAWPNGNGTVNIGTLAANSDWVRLTKTFIPSNYQENKVSAYSIYIFLEGDVDFQIKQIKIEFGNKVTDYTPAPEDVSDDATTKANAAQAAAQEYALAKANLAEVTAKAYADGIVTAEEQRAIADATNKVNAIQVGGRNLLLNSRNVSYNGDWVSSARDRRAHSR
jgi:hypothetical protein